MLNNIYTVVVKGNQKAIIGFVLAFVTTYLASVGLSLDMTIGEALTSLVSGAITAAGVWVKANKE